ncbi:MAG: hypothetical protein LBF72_00345 [Holosporales bacterium]|nr:hypothetical protein [Holosporales bacterium]
MVREHSSNGSTNQKAFCLLEYPVTKRVAGRRHVVQKRSVLMVREHSSNGSTNQKTFCDWVYWF